MAEVVLNTIFQLKRGLLEAWERNNPILRQGEPGYVLDTGKLKIGDGSTAWKDLEYFDCGFSITADGKSIMFEEDHLALYGFAAADIGAAPRKTKEGTLEWYNPATQEGLEALRQALESDISTISAGVEKIKYEVSSKPAGTLVDYRDKEIRVMCPSNTDWKLQSSGAGADANSYYIGIKAYAPNDDIVSFKEDMGEIISDQTMYYFENNEFAGIDTNGRKYSIIWLPVAKYDAATGTWTYHGSKSSVDHYVGWYYSVEWYDANGNKIDADTIRIALSNEECHGNVLPYYLGEYQKKTDSISVSRLVNDENTVLVFNGGSAEDLV